MSVTMTFKIKENPEGHVFTGREYSALPSRIGRSGSDVSYGMTSIDKKQALCDRKFNRACSLEGRFLAGTAFKGAHIQFAEILHPLMVVNIASTGGTESKPLHSAED